MDAQYSISQLSREFAITPRTLRFYETHGILSPRRQGTTRIYSDRDRVRLTLALRGRRVGLSLEEVRRIIDMYDPAQPDDPRQTVFLLEKLREHRRELINRINDINETLKAMDEIEARTMAALNRRGGPKTNQLALELGE
ncbi:MAG TPA: MerR family DNA-binding transcriptional regulator [Gammaproteobacteria bacterium]|nr:MerR family DNA-binding transcriptional regulator [Gammaproteobacteria bacterium]